METDFLDENDKLIQSFEILMADFDFNTVHRVMEFLNWKWYFNLFGEGCVPGIADMKEFCRSIFYRALKDYRKEKESIILDSGGFKVTILKGDYLYLDFILTKMEYDPDADNWNSSYIN